MPAGIISYLLYSMELQLGQMVKKENNKEIVKAQRSYHVINVSWKLHKDLIFKHTEKLFIKTFKGFQLKSRPR